MLTVQSVQADVAESYDRTCGDVAVYYWMTGGRMGSRHVALFERVVGCHVAQSGAATWHPGSGCHCCLLKCMESVGFDPRTSPPHNIPQTPITNRATAYALTYMCFGFNIKSIVGMVLGRDRAGPSPALGRALSYICDHGYVLCIGVCVL
jgi:hypothetical protein